MSLVMLKIKSPFSGQRMINFSISLVLQGYKKAFRLQGIDYEYIVSPFKD